MCIIYISAFDISLHIYLCMFVFVYLCLDMRIYASLFACVCFCVCICICIFVFVFVYICLKRQDMKPFFGTGSWLSLICLPVWIVSICMYVWYSYACVCVNASCSSPLVFFSVSVFILSIYFILFYFYFFRHLFCIQFCNFVFIMQLGKLCLSVHVFVYYPHLCETFSFYLWFVICANIFFLFSCWQKYSWNPCFSLHLIPWYIYVVICICEYLYLVLVCMCIYFCIVLFFLCFFFLHPLYKCKCKSFSLAYR